MKELTPTEFLAEAEHSVIIDVRAPEEFQRGHIPGANNLPLFDDDERAIVGILYKNEGRKIAIEKGLEIVGPKMKDLVTRTEALSSERKVLVHCWRGGMRSSSFAWLLETAGFEVSILKGGYKSYRQFIRNEVLTEHQLIVLGGLTGSGKTRVLEELEKMGEAVLDLEGLASHRGSAFGAIGLPEQPSNEQFENNVFAKIKCFPKGEWIWVEDESKRIGRIFINDKMFQVMRSAPVLMIQVDFEQRLDILLSEYATQDPVELDRSIVGLNKRLGGLITKKAREHLKKGEVREVARLILPYYDKTYGFGLSNRDHSSITEIPFSWSDPELSMKNLIQYKQRIKSPKF